MVGQQEKSTTDVRRCTQIQTLISVHLRASVVKNSSFFPSLYLTVQFYTNTSVMKFFATAILQRVLVSNSRWFLPRSGVMQPPAVTIQTSV
jgi:hypothetical protein